MDLQTLGVRGSVSLLFLDETETVKLFRRPKKITRNNKIFYKGSKGVYLR